MKNIVFTFFCCCLLAISCLGATNSVKKARKQKCNIVAVSCKDNSRKYAENKAYMTQFNLCSYKNNYIFDATKFLASNASMPVRQKISNVNFLCHVDKNTAYVINTSNATICNRVNGENAVQENAVVNKTANNEKLIEDNSVVSKTSNNQTVIEENAVVNRTTNNGKAVQENVVVSKTANNQIGIEENIVVSVSANNQASIEENAIVNMSANNEKAIQENVVVNKTSSNQIGIRENAIVNTLANNQASIEENIVVNMSTSNEKAITDNAIIYENNSFHNSAFFNSSVYKKNLMYLNINSFYSYQDLAFGSSFSEAIKMLNDPYVPTEKKSKINKNIINAILLKERLEKQKFSLK